MQPRDQIARTPAYHTVRRWNWALLHEPDQKGPVHFTDLGRTPGEGMLMRPSVPCSLNRISEPFSRRHCDARRNP